MIIGHEKVYEWNQAITFQKHLTKSSISNGVNDKMIEVMVSL